MKKFTQKERLEIQEKILKNLEQKLADDFYKSVEIEATFTIERDYKNYINLAYDLSILYPINSLKNYSKVNQLYEEWK